VREREERRHEAARRERLGQRHFPWLHSGRLRERAEGFGFGRSGIGNLGGDGRPCLRK
jgi:hypothetical protein